MQYIDDAEFQIAIDLDNGARISSITWRELQFTIPYRGSPLHSGWYAMGPWAGRVRDGIIRGADGEVFQLPTNIVPPHAMRCVGHLNTIPVIANYRRGSECIRGSPVT